MRNFSLVMKQMLQFIPASETSLIIELEYCLENSFYRPPEDTLGWHKVSEILFEYLHPPIKDWEFEVLHIFTQMSIEDLKKLISESK